MEGTRARQAPRRGFRPKGWTKDITFHLSSRHSEKLEILASICGKIGQAPVQKILRNGKTVMIFTVGTGGILADKEMTCYILASSLSGAESSGESNMETEVELNFTVMNYFLFSCSYFLLSAVFGAISHLLSTLKGLKNFNKTTADLVAGMAKIDNSYYPEESLMFFHCAYFRYAGVVTVEGITDVLEVPFLFVEGIVVVHNSIFV
ncbi:hypothetical protein Syun_004004 [Stephania yunnanensis]|uniref:Uncharacterized protein n=1 Tax=Stephania yunnanensis TaxID=152371 RepID=A0AAP0Q0C5_9MAGN